jgi:signal transduction histidine kinase
LARAKRSVAHVTESHAPGLRTQILLALAVLMAFTFVPIFFAVASLARATLHEARQEAALSLGRAVAAHVGEADAPEGADVMRQRLESHVGQGGVAAIAVYDEVGRLLAEAGDPPELALIAAPSRPYGESSRTVHGVDGHELEVVVPEGAHAVVARVRTDESAALAAPLVRLVALYMVTFALSLLVFAYLALTRLIVKPIDALVHAADRVASAHTIIDLPHSGPRELLDLATSLHAMTHRLGREQEAMRSKVDELTRMTKRVTETQSHLVRTERLASVGRLAAGVAHEIGNPLAALMGMQDLLLDDDLPRETQHDFLGRMKRETERIHHVLRDLLDFARPEKPDGGVQSQHPPTIVAAVVRDVFALVRPQQAIKSVTLVNEATDEGLHVAVSAGRLTQVILNLVLNAADAIAGEDDGHPATITVRASREDDHVRLEVEDNGPGVPSAMHERLFEPFVTTKEIGKGTGLGLAVCRGIVESANGDISLDVSPERGARFVVRLPAASSAMLPGR